MPIDAERPPPAAVEQLAALRRRADADFASPPLEFEPGRHTADVAALGLKVTVTRSLYPNRPDGNDLYAVTITTLAVDRAPSEPAVRTALQACFGEAAEQAEPRPGGPRVRMFRLRAGLV